MTDSAPYGHDGRWPDLGAAIAGHVPALPAAQRADILAFLQAAGGAEDAVRPATFRLEMGELAAYVGLLDETLRRGDAGLTRFVVDTVNIEMRRVQRAFPEGDAVRLAGRPDRHKQLPLDYDALRGGLDRVASLAEAGDRGAAQAALEAYHENGREDGRQLPAARPVRGSSPPGGGGSASAEDLGQQLGRAAIGDGRGAGIPRMAAHAGEGVVDARVDIGADLRVALQARQDLLPRLGGDEFLRARRCAASAAP